jgi:radical SAM superfamily enzyme YgiQ (UPF0313 family)
MTSLGTWDGLETGKTGKHGLTFPLAILRALLVESGLDATTIDCFEGDRKPKGPWGIVAISAMDSRHFWRFPEYMRTLNVPLWADRRSEDHSIVVVGGQSCYAPGPILPFADVVYVGEAEVSAVALFRSLSSDASRSARLEAASKLPGCWVPSIHGFDHEIEAVYTDDPTVSIRQAGNLTVNLREIRRVEIARGCPKRCPFCCLGWRQPYRPVPAARIIPALEAHAAMGQKEIHLQAGDAESHPEIDEIRSAMIRLGLFDHSWTGRMDSYKDWHVTPGKLFAFGIEGVSERLRKDAGKPGYSNQFIAENMERIWRGGGRRIVLHFIGGLPGETVEDMVEFEDLLADLEQVAKDVGRGTERLTFAIGRQPFGPLPHTPWQRKAPGLSHDRMGAILQRYRGGRYLHIEDNEGQRYLPAVYAAIPMRSGAEIAHIIEGGQPPVSARCAIGELTEILGTDRPWREWSVDELLPWAGVKTRWKR